MTRSLVWVLRGISRLVLGLSVIGSVTYATLWLVELAGKRGAIGFETMVDGFWLVLTIAVGLGAACAAATDRLWRRVRGRGPKLVRTP